MLYELYKYKNHVYKLVTVTVVVVHNDKISVFVEIIIVIGRPCICFPLSVKLSTGF